MTIDAELFRRLVAEQFPHWADLPVTPVAVSGWDNRTFHLGPDMVIRAPSAEVYAAQVDKEQQWLPRLASRLPLTIPRPLACGEPGEGFPWRWSVYGWIVGDTAAAQPRIDQRRLATDLADFLAALQAIDASGGPPAGPHNFFRGGPIATYDDADAVRGIWSHALASRWAGPPVWVHGDIAPGNLLLRDGKLCAVIDWGILATGDPACDLAIAWSFFDGPARAAFRTRLAVDDETWARGRGWALWKALILATGVSKGRPREVADARRVIEAIMGEA
jgi:aminoglycoside phosphotransferase (APT) family kinase protein